MSDKITLIKKKEINAMIKNSGFYICGDTSHPEASVPITSIGGVLYSMTLDEELSVDKFLPTVTINGPFHKV